MGGDGSRPAGRLCGMPRRML